MPNQIICPTCDNSELEIWEIRKYSAMTTDEGLEIENNPNEHSITHIYCEQCDPAHSTNLVHLLNGLEIDVQFL